MPKEKFPDSAKEPQKDKDSEGEPLFNPEEEQILAPPTPEEKAKMEREYFRNEAARDPVKDAIQGASSFAGLYAGLEGCDWVEPISEIKKFRESGDEEILKSMPEKNGLRKEVKELYEIEKRKESAIDREIDNLEKNKRLLRAEDFEELFKILDEIEFITTNAYYGSKIGSSKLREQIAEVRKHPRATKAFSEALGKITKEAGLRAKVDELILADYAREKAAEDPYEAAIKKAKSFSALYGAIEGGGAIQGSAEKFEPEKLIEIIEEVRKGTMEVRSMTSSKGLREKVKELLEKFRATQTMPGIELARRAEAEKLINEAGDFVELFAKLELVGPLLGKIKIGAEMLDITAVKEIINRMRKTKADGIDYNVNIFSRDYGLRAKVKELLEKEK
ncbi:MAG TPA: hypothetical protein VJB92_02745 [Candidatus Paceibacterota bacterium]